MKKNLSAIGTVILVLFFSGMASAAMWSDYDKINKKLKEGKSYVTYNLDIAVADNFVVGVDTVTSADVWFWLADDSSNDGYEYASLWIEDTGWFDVGEVNSGNKGNTLYGAYSLNAAGLAKLNKYGRIGIGAYAQYTGDKSSGDFIFKAAQVDAYGTEPVPEPATIFLFGLGLAGLVGYSRKRK